MTHTPTTSTPTSCRPDAGAPGTIDPYYIQHAEAAREKLKTQPRMTMARAIRRKCLGCSGDNSAEVRRCQVFNCPLWRLRFGKKGETLAKTHPEHLDPVHVFLEGIKADLRERGKSTWQNPLTGNVESLATEIDSDGSGA